MKLFKEYIKMEDLEKFKSVWETDRKDIWTQINALGQKKSFSDDLGARVAELELKMSKLWAMLTETTPRGKEKLSRFGRRFGGANLR